MVRRRTSVRSLAPLAVAFAIGLSSCTGTPAQTAPAGGVAIDGLAKLDVGPVDYGGKRVVTAIFGDISAGRPVTLQKRQPSGWDTVARGEEDRWGEAEFLADAAPDDVFRAVAEASDDGRQAAVATPEGHAGELWKPALSTQFRGPSRPSQWEYGEADYSTDSRSCSAQFDSNAVFVGRELQLLATEETDSSNIARARLAGCKNDAVLRTGLISTDRHFTIRSGLVALRVRFPAGQGVHGSVRLQVNGERKVDVINSLGYGRGLTSAIVVNGERSTPRTAQAADVDRAAADPAWWTDYHVVSAQWDQSSLVVRMDGVPILRTDAGIPLLSYFIVVGLLSSDSEQQYLTKPKGLAPGSTPPGLPQTMYVDWVKAWMRP
jgi:hypothetical protein